MQIKKFTSLFLAILILISSFGLAFNVHYCGDKIASLSAAFSTVETSSKQTLSKENCCCINESGEKNSCCKNKFVDLKKDTKDVIVKTFSFQIDAPFIVVKSSELLFRKVEINISNTVLTEYYCSPNAPPLFKLYQQYIFYA